MLEVVSHGVIGTDRRIVLAGCHATDRQASRSTNRKSNGQFGGHGGRQTQGRGEERRGEERGRGEDEEKTRRPKEEREGLQRGIGNICSGLTAGLPPSASSRQPHTTKTGDGPEMV